MSPSVADHDLINEGPSASGRLNQYLRTTSSLSTASSDFEFESWSFSELNDEPPISPKLNYSPNWRSGAVLASTNHNFAEIDSALESLNSNYVVHQDHQVTYNFKNGSGLSHEIKANGHTDPEYESLPRNNSEYAGGDDQIKRDVKGDKHEFSSLKGELVDVISINDEINGDGYGGKEGKRVNLRSLLDRRDLEQLVPLNYVSSHQNKKDQKLQVSCSPSPSSSASSLSGSPLHQCSDHCNSPSPCRNEDHDNPLTPKSRSCEKKCKRWAFKLDFLRRTVPSSRTDHHHLNKRCSSTDHHQASDYGLNQRCSSDHLASNYELNQRYGRINAAAELEDRFDDQRMIGNDRNSVAAAAVITKFDSPRKSTGSSRHASSSPKYADNDQMMRGTRNVSRSAPISPAASPTRSSAAAAGGGFTLRGPGTPPTSPHTRRASPRGGSPMSSHALHYQQQKARAEELRRKTFLPYRQSLLGACFFPAQLQSTPPPAAHRPPVLSH